MQLGSGFAKVVAHNLAILNNFQGDKVLQIGHQVIFNFSFLIFGSFFFLYFKVSFKISYVMSRCRGDNFYQS